MLTGQHCNFHNLSGSYRGKKDHVGPLTPCSDCLTPWNGFRNSFCTSAELNECLYVTVWFRMRISISESTVPTNGSSPPGRVINNGEFKRDVSQRFSSGKGAAVFAVVHKNRKRWAKRQSSQTTSWSSFLPSPLSIGCDIILDTLDGDRLISHSTTAAPSGRRKESVEVFWTRPAGRRLHTGPGTPRDHVAMSGLRWQRNSSLLSSPKTRLWRTSWRRTDRWRLDWCGPSTSKGTPVVETN